MSPDLKISSEKFGKIFKPFRAEVEFVNDQQM